MDRSNELLIALTAIAVGAAAALLAFGGLRVAGAPAGVDRLGAEVAFFVALFATAVRAPRPHR